MLVGVQQTAAERIEQAPRLDLFRGAAALMKGARFGQKITALAFIIGSFAEVDVFKINKKPFVKA